MNPIKIRKATISDLEIIQEISRQTFIETFAEVNTPENIKNYIQENFNSEQVALEINNRESAFYLAILDYETIAYLKINFGNAQTEIHSSQSMEIHRIYVLKKFHGKKIGQILLNEAIKIGQQSGVDSIWLGVWEKNHKAIQFYINNDFVEFDKHHFTLGNDVQTDLLMELRIINQANYL
ncbi:GNAT family N-acetyltransferase [Flavobacterium franklandianum]|uniref:GNAT family N-acetyltransferase n=1 Tax=Flavobacterium franklandianum TaxID=2594430 RepID=A0A553CNP7_9FLAO|nr:GNAT family N-acetyltransferase [Flavobacterium franklandianum]TRX22097.1 GNAT family N-acetyltransferase [Flavobacterium franklandianum]TRX28681.1 GNAT family N-acetyltransferase [Flavobacterium franklandianum]